MILADALRGTAVPSRITRHEHGAPMTSSSTFSISNSSRRHDDVTISMLRNPIPIRAASGSFSTFL